MDRREVAAGTVASLSRCDRQGLLGLQPRADSSARGQVPGGRCRLVLWQTLELAGPC